MEAKPREREPARRFVSSERGGEPWLFRRSPAPIQVSDASAPAEAVVCHPATVASACGRGARDLLVGRGTRGWRRIMSSSHRHWYGDSV